MPKLVFNLGKVCFNKSFFGHIVKPQLCVSSHILVKHCTRQEAFHQYCTKPPPEPQKPLTLIQRFKQMYRDYWYVLVPVHLVTSAGWFGGFYYLAKSGVDIAALLETVHLSDKITNPLKDSSMGYVAVSYALYKIATPLRYTVTLGGTTISINYLKEWGYIKPVPTANQLKEIYKERKDNILETIHEYKVKDLDKGPEEIKTVKGIKSNNYMKIPKKT